MFNGKLWQDQLEQAKGVLPWLGLVFLIFFLDQLTKQLIVERFYLSERLIILPVFDLIYVHNEGAAFSFLSDAGGWQRWFLSGVSILISLFLLAWLYRLPKTDKWLALALSLVLGGALGNVYDRLLLGYVVDFISVHYQGYRFPAFNIADSAISVGAFLLLVHMFPLS